MTPTARQVWAESSSAAVLARAGHPGRAGAAADGGDGEDRHPARGERKARSATTTSTRPRERTAGDRPEGMDANSIERPSIERDRSQDREHSGLSRDATDVRSTTATHCGQGPVRRTETSSRTPDQPCPITAGWPDGQVRQRGNTTNTRRSALTHIPHHRCRHHRPPTCRFTAHMTTALPIDC